MRRLKLLIITLLTACLQGMAQQVTPALTVYREFQPATIHLADGRQLKVGLANIFLKNSGLLYKSGIETKEANLKTISSVDFKDRTYYRIDTVLAYRVDTIGHDALYRAQRIDFAAWKQMIANNSSVTNLNLGDLVGVTTADLSMEQDIHFPIIDVYYYLLNGKYVLVHERNLKQALNKEKRRLMAAVMATEGFSWNDEKSLLRLLRMIQ